MASSVDGRPPADGTDPSGLVRWSRHLRASGESEDRSAEGQTIRHLSTETLAGGTVRLRYEMRRRTAA